MSFAAKKLNYCFEEYLVLEAKASFKREFYQGKIFPISGDTRNHSILSMNVNAELRAVLHERDCAVFGSDLMIRIEAVDAAVYPDGMVICGAEEFFETKRIL